MVLPAEFRKAMGLEPGDEVILVLDEQGIRILSVEQAVSRAQALVRRYIGPGKELSGELIEQRRRESEDE